jgi:hypothetical protein
MLKPLIGNWVTSITMLYPEAEAGTTSNGRPRAAFQIV